MTTFNCSLQELETFSFDTADVLNSATSAVIVPVYKGKSEEVSFLKEDFAFLGEEGADFVVSFLKKRSFGADLGKVLSCTLVGGELVVFVGMGLREDGLLISERYRRIGSFVKPVLGEYSVTDCSVVLSDSLDCSHDSFQALCEGLLMAQYTFDAYRSSKKDDAKKDTVLKQCALFCSDISQMEDALERAKIVVDHIEIAQDVVNRSSDDITPVSFADRVVSYGAEYGFEVEVFDKKGIEKKGFSLLEAVGRASVHESRFVVAHYVGRQDNSEVVDISLVGKGVTYDTGGVNLKPSFGGFLEEMHSDMAGAGTVLGSFLAAVSLKLPLNIALVIPLAENALGGNAFKPGTVLSSYKGTTVEVINTDAEGRLLLADALWYACSDLKSSIVVDVATLTGACMVALGTVCAGAVSNSDSLFSDLSSAGDHQYERLWQLPLFEEYREDVKGRFGDVRNLGKLGGGRFAGAVTAATFLENFIDSSTKWAHIDIAGTAFASSPTPYVQYGATGFGVRLLVDWLSDFSAE